jgi:predicted nucleotidyltransferase
VPAASSERFRYPWAMTSPTPTAVQIRAAIVRQRSRLVEVLAQYGATNLRMFGSVARGDAREDSDLYLPVDLVPGSGNELLRVAGLAEELSDILGLRVDVVAATLLRDEVSSTALAEAIAV